MFKIKKIKDMKDFNIDIAKTGAWNNAPVLEDKPKEEFRVCMYCQFPLEYRLFIEEKNNVNNSQAWTIDIINLRKNSSDPDNLLAIHANCMGNRKNNNEEKRLKKYHKAKWMYPKD